MNQALIRRAVEMRRLRRQKRNDRTEREFVDSTPAPKVVPAKKGRFNKLLLPRVAPELGDRNGTPTEWKGSLWRFDAVTRTWVEMKDLNEPNRVILRWASPRKGV